MSFFTDGPRERPRFPVREQELFGYEGRPWTGPPTEHIVPALLPWAMPLGRSERTVVALRAIEVWPEALTFRISVYARDRMDDAPLVAHRRIPDYNALLVGVLFPDGSRASSETISVPSAGEPHEPVLRVEDGAGSAFHREHPVFVWPLPSAGPMKLIVQWLDRGIEETHTKLDGGQLRAAAREAGELWPGLPKRPGNGVAMRQVAAEISAAEQGAGGYGDADYGVSGHGAGGYGGADYGAGGHGGVDYGAGGHGAAGYGAAERDAAPQRAFGHGAAEPDAAPPPVIEPPGPNAFRRGAAEQSAVERSAIERGFAERSGIERNAERTAAEHNGSGGLPRRFPRRAPGE